jgi:hypothetical protein
MNSKRVDDTPKFTFKDIVALVIATYQIILPRVITLIVSIILIGLGLKVFLN